MIINELSLPSWLTDALIKDSNGKSIHYAIHKVLKQHYKDAKLVSDLNYTIQCEDGIKLPEGRKHHSFGKK